MESREVHLVRDQYDVWNLAVFDSKTEAQNLARLLTDYIMPAKVVTMMVSRDVQEWVDTNQSNYAKVLRRNVPKALYRKARDSEDINGIIGGPAGPGWH